MNKDDVELLSNHKFVSAKQMLLVIFTIAVVLQSVSYFIPPSEWLNWQLLVFITSTNLGAVILAIQAQRSADDIGDVQRRIFTPEFYRSMKSISKLHGLIEDEAELQGHSIYDELNDMAPKIYGLTRAYLDVRAKEEGITPPDPVVEKPPQSYEDEDLFQ